RLARDPALHPRVRVQPVTSCGGASDSSSGADSVRDAQGSQPDERKVTTADVLEAVHRACGLPIVADFYTRLYSPAEVSVQNEPVFDALNWVADSMRLRWIKEGDW